MPVIQMYSLMYYSTKLKVVVDEEWATSWKAQNPGSTYVPPVEIQFRNKVVQRLYDAEPEDVKNHVECKRNERYEKAQEALIAVDVSEIESGEDAEEEGRERLREARRYQR